MSDEINDQETPGPEVPNGASPSLDPEIAKRLSEEGAEALGASGPEYIEEKGDVMNPEALLNRFKELSEVDNPGMAILVTEVQELKAYSHRIGVIVSAALPMITACAICAIILTSRILAEGDSK
jgi:hypothetical protein